MEEEEAMAGGLRVGLIYSRCEMETSDAVKIQACFVSLYLFLTIPVSPPLLLLSSL
jgi:hypothetical protein